MPKAILELEMPESCTECMFKECLNRTTSVEVSRCIILHKMHVPGSYCPAEGRQADCPLKLVEGKEVNRMRIFLMNDDYGTVVAAKDEEQAQKYFRGTFNFEVDDDYCSVKREIFPGEIGIFEDINTMTFGEFTKGIPEENIPVILCWAE